MKEELYEKEVRSEQRYGVASFILEIIKIVVLAFVIIVPVRVFLFQPFFVQGASMEPNFEDKEYLIINELGYKKTSVGFGDTNFFTVNPFKEIKRQHVIVFRYPLDPGKYFIKRVIGLPGEKIEVKEGSVTVFNQQNPNGMSLDEAAYLSKSVRTTGDLSVTLASDEYFVMGDNRMFSSDSRVWGPVKEKFIMGEVLLRAWPLNRVSIY